MRLARSRRNSDAVETLAATKVLLSRAQSDQSLTLVNRGSDETDPADFKAVTKALAPLLTEVRRVGRGPGAADSAAYDSYKAQAEPRPGTREGRTPQQRDCPRIGRRLDRKPTERLIGRPDHGGAGPLRALGSRRDLLALRAVDRDSDIYGRCGSARAPRPSPADGGVPMRRSALALVALVLVAASVAACGSGSDRAQRTALAALRTPQPTPSTTPPPTRNVRCRNARASLRPPAVMPTRGAMPAGSFMARIERRGHLIAGVDQNTLLFAYFDPRARRIVGFEIDMLHQLAKAIFGDPNKVEFKAITTQERVPAVQNGTVDVVADAMTITCARRQDVDFSTVYYDAGQKILVPSNSPVRASRISAASAVCATRGSTSIATLEQQVPRPVAYPVDQRTDCLVALQEGKVAAITSDDSILLGFEAQDPDTKIVGPSFAPEPYGIAISKAHPGFVRFVNGVLAKMRADGTWKAIYKKWLVNPGTGLGKPRPAIPAPPPAQYDG